MLEKNKNYKICGAKTKSGKPCQGKAMDNDRCRMHGGRNVKDSRELAESTRNVPGRPPKHGKYSKYLKHTLKDKYEDFMSDPDMLSLKDELAQTRALTARFMEKFDEDKYTIDDLESINKLTSEIRKLADTINKIELSRKLALSPEDVRRILALIADIITRFVTDEDTRLEIIEEIRKIRVT